MANHYFIGIGGMGGNVLCALRKAMHLRKSEIEKVGDRLRCGFLYVDSNDQELFHSERQWQILGTSVDLEPIDKLLIKEGNIAAVLNNIGQQPAISSWIGDLRAISGVLGAQTGVPGAQQRRRFGRFLFATHAQGFKNKIQLKVEQMKQGVQVQCEFHLIGTFAGGTGSGSLVDAALAIRSLYPDAAAYRITLYAFITEDAAGTSDYGYFYPNQYAALKDVNVVMLGKSLLTDVGAPEQAVFNKQQPIHRCFLLSNQNAHQIALSKADQERILAEWLLQLAVATAAGALGKEAQHAITGEDAIQNRPGEPPDDPVRSYSFGSVGILRWSTPQQLIRERLASGTSQKLVNQILYNNWNENLGGYLEEPRPSNVEDYYNAHPLSAWGISLTQITTEGHSADRFETQWAVRLNNAINRHSSDTGNVLLLLEQDAARYYDHNFQDTGVEAYFRQLTNAKEAKTGSLATLIEDELRGAVRAGQLGVTDVLVILERLGRDVDLEIARCQTERQDDLEGTKTLDDSLTRRRNEWPKVGPISKLLGKKRQLIEQHASTLVGMFTRRTRVQALRYAETLLASIKTELARIQAAVAHIKTELETARDAFERDYATVAAQLSEPGSLAKVELVEAEFAALEKCVRESRQHLRPAADAVRLSLFEHRTFFDVAQAGANIQRGIERESDATVLRAHEDLVKDPRNGLSPMVGVNLIEVLYHRSQAQTDALLPEIQAFVGKAVAALRFDAAAAQPYPETAMPKRHLLIQLPDIPPSGDAETHQKLAKFRSELERAFRGSEREGAEISFAPSSDPTEITVVAVVFWMAARFAAPVQRLKEKYLAAMKSIADGRNARYFCHLDDNYSTVPDLFPPERGTVTMMGRCLLDIGRRAKIVREDGTGQIFLYITDNGVVTTRLLGRSEADFLNASDAQIQQHVSAIKSELRKLPKTTLDDIANERGVELKAMAGDKIDPASEQYRSVEAFWNERLKYLEELRK